MRPRTNILLAEDVVFLGMPIQENLELEGYELYHAQDGEQVGINYTLNAAAL